MTGKKTFAAFLIYISLVFILGELIYYTCGEVSRIPSDQFILSSEAYQDDWITNVWDRLVHRMRVQPFNIVSFVIFLCAIVHTFCIRLFNKISSHLKRRYGEESFLVELFRFLGEVEVVFGIWVIPLMIGMSLSFDWCTALDYLNSRSYAEPLFVVIIMALVSTGPIMSLAEDGLYYIAKLGNHKIKAWWWTILTIGPISGSLIAEPGAMTISAILLERHFYPYKPSLKFSYATLGLLFVNVSVGGVLTSFAAPPVLMIRRAWGWDTGYMFTTFGYKAVIALILANLCYYLIFRNEFKLLEKRKQEIKSIEKEKERIPFWVTFFHVAFLSWIVVHAQYPAVVIGSFLFFLGFYQATIHHQTKLSLKSPILVGFFLAGLVIHGGLQGWWISTVLTYASDGVLMIFSTILTAFNDNAEITYLSTLIPNLADSTKYAIVAGAVTGGGLTVIANAPNPAGQAILLKFFKQGVSGIRLFVAALIPTLIVGLIFFLYQIFPG